MSSVIEFTFDDKELTGEKGQSIAAVLISLGTPIVRLTRFEKQPRSIFCVIGICFDCVVIVDGVANQRACLTQIRQGMSVRSQP